MVPPLLSLIPALLAPFSLVRFFFDVVYPMSLKLPSLSYQKAARAKARPKKTRTAANGIRLAHL
jgi:hypothetical protein